MSFTDPVIKAGNAALSINQPTGLDMHLTSHGSDWFWSVFACFGLALIYYSIMLRISKTKKLLFGLALIPVLFEFVIYFAMASNLGWAGVKAEFGNRTAKAISHPIRQVFYAKYIGWVFSYPVLLTFLEIAASESEIIIFDSSFIIYVVIQIFSSLFFSVCLLIGSLIKSTYKWGFFVFAVFGVFHSLFTLYHRIIFVKTGKNSIIFLSFFAGIIWILYLVSWGLSEGSNTIQPDSEAIFYGILDLIQFGIVPFIIITFIPVTGNVVLQLPEHVIEKITTKEIEVRHSGETAIQSNTPTPIPETV